ncbi:S-layer homology domain-containing protein [Paenibacillus sp. NEAU-GSW1]|uniref:S-layer homology domain-containing protein n=1 Tax=Paenibacillus sp. NEAU-GSW1 TaxID=2682486 RepID=UPI001562FB13|nr:S-layer homology domain-containing protein [Paenibacillus sp. NEAU-GSW1]
MRRKFVCLSLILTLTIGSGIWPAAAQEAHAAEGDGIVYVKASAAGRNNGTSWSNAYRDLEQALSKTEVNSGTEIWVAKGTYYPSAHQTGSDRRTRHFEMENGVAIRGGFAGTETFENGVTKEALLANRNFAVNETILSADINKDKTANGNVYSVFKNDGLNNSAILDGVTVTGGAATNSDTYHSGGGMANTNSSPVISNVVFLKNEAIAGGGIANWKSSPVLTNVTFNGNQSSGSGGAIFNNNESHVIITNALFIDNRASHGGGVYNTGSSPVFTNVTLTGNSASVLGGGIANDGASKPQLRNGIVWNNPDGNMNSIANSNGGNIDISYSIVQDNQADGALHASVGNSVAGNSDYNPQFQSDESFPRLKAESPAVDKGSNAVFAADARPDLSRIATDRDGRSRIVNGKVDIGAFEYTAASRFDITLSKDQEQITSGPVQVTVTAALEGAGNGVVQLKWAQGERDAAYFAKSGNDITSIGRASITANGTYTFYARDLRGNEIVKTIAIANIYNVKPVINLTPNTTQSTTGPVQVTAAVDIQGAGNSLAQLKWEQGDRNADYFATQGADILDPKKFSVSANGVYTVFAKDKAGNAAVKTITISNIITKDRPSIATALSTSSSTNGPVEVTVIATVNASGASLSKLKWASGDRDAAYFSNRGTTVTNGGKFSVTTNGTYTIYAKDSYGNETVKTVTISNIRSAPPVIQTSLSPTKTTTGNVTVTITVVVQGSGNNLDTLKWQSGQRNEDYFASNGKDITNTSKFTVGSNGTYTVYAEDTAGNKSVKVIQISNIRESTPPPSGNWCTSINSRILVEAGQSAVLNYTDQIWVSIPSGAASKELCYTLERADTPEKTTGAGESLLSGYFNWGADVSAYYSKPAQLTIAFNKSQLKSNQKASVYSYDAARKQWTELGGTVDGSFIRVEIGGVTTGTVYAVFVKTVVPQVYFTDITGHWAAGGIRSAAEKGIVQGDSSGRFRPNASITRAEFIVMVMNATGQTSNGSTIYFKDQADIGSWARDAVSQAVRTGLINGYDDGTFRPNALITRAEIAAIVGRMLGIPSSSYSSTGFADDRLIPKWAKSAVETLRREDVIDGRSGNRFEPLENATRAEAVVLLLRAMELY